MTDSSFTLPTVKPRPPDNLTLHWLEDAVRVTCPALPHPGLDYVIQHRGPGDSDWVVSSDVIVKTTSCSSWVNCGHQGPAHRLPVPAPQASAPAPSCDVTVSGVDRDACLAFRARASPRESFYGHNAQSSDWSHVTRWRAGLDAGDVTRVWPGGLCHRCGAGRG